MLVRFALMYVMLTDDPWSAGQDIIAHVHESNPKPRRLLDHLLFEYKETRAYPGEGLPRKMKRNSEGMVVGDIFHFTRQGLRALADWFTNEFQGTLKNGATVEFRLGNANLDEMIEDLRTMASQYS